MNAPTACGAAFAPVRAARILGRFLSVPGWAYWLALAVSIRLVCW
jgi:hypothetical protein